MNFSFFRTVHSGNYGIWLQCLTSSCANPKPKFQNRLSQNWLNQISNKNYLTHSIVCRMLNNFCLKFGSANFETACSETDESICTTRYQTLYHSFLAKFPSNQRFTKELYSKLIWRKKIWVAWQRSEFLVFLNCATMWKLREFTSAQFWNFLKVTVLLKKSLLKKCFHEIFFQWEHSVVWYLMSEIYPHFKKFSWNQFTVRLVSK